MLGCQKSKHCDGLNSNFLSFHWELVAIDCEPEETRGLSNIKLEENETIPMIPVFLLHIINQIPINLSMRCSTPVEYGRPRDATLLRDQRCKVESGPGQHLRSNPGECHVLEILRLIRLSRCRDKPCLQGLLQPQSKIDWWGVLAKRQDVPRHDEGLRIFMVDLVSEARESFLSCSERTQANRGGVIVCIDWNCEKIVGSQWWSDRSS